MKSYPSIPREVKNLDIVAFDKLDGSNIRAEWNPKKGFYKFGSRKVLLDKNHEHLGKAVTLIQDTYFDGLTTVFTKQRWNKNVVCFFEFHGPRSFAGQHHQEDDHKVTLLDVSPYKQGLVPPSLFIKLFSDLGIPDILYRGTPDQTFIDSVRLSTLEGMSLEGVVCKAPNPNGKKTSQPVMFKLKALRWLDLLKEYCAGDEGMFSQLA